MTELGIKPIPDESSLAYWQGARRGKLLFQRCPACRSAQFYPRPFCGICLAADPAWVEAGGRGTIHTFSVVHRTSDKRFSHLVPYVLAIVELDEGVRMMANIRTAPGERIACDDPVQVVFEDHGDHVLPQFATLQALAAK